MTIMTWWSFAFTCFKPLSLDGPTKYSHFNFVFICLFIWPGGHFPFLLFSPVEDKRQLFGELMDWDQVLIRVENNIIVNDWCKSKKIALDKMVFRSDACCNWFMLKYGKRNLKRSHFFPKGFSFLCFQIPIQKTKDRWDTGSQGDGTFN